MLDSEKHTLTNY